MPVRLLIVKAVFVPIFPNNAHILFFFFVFFFFLVLFLWGVGSTFRPDRDWLKISPCRLLMQKEKLMYMIFACVRFLFSISASSIDVSYRPTHTFHFRGTHLTLKWENMRVYGWMNELARACKLQAEIDSCSRKS